MATNGHTTTAIQSPSDLSEIADDALHVSESTSVSRERQYPSGTDIDYLLGLLRNQRSTGQLVIDLSQGSVCNIRFLEKQRVSP
jgi:hypothetical protein